LDFPSSFEGPPGGALRLAPIYLQLIHDLKLDFAACWIAKSPLPIWDGLSHERFCKLPLLGVLAGCPRQRRQAYATPADVL
jgi:hypothetical protein